MGMFGEARRLCRFCTTFTVNPASCLIVEVAGPRFRLAAGRRRVWAVAFCFSAYVHAVCYFAQLHLWSLLALVCTVPYSTVQFDLVGWSYDSPVMAAAFCLTVTAYRRVDTSRLLIFGSVQAELKPFLEVMWPC